MRETETMAQEKSVLWTSLSILFDKSEKVESRTHKISHGA